VEPQSKVGSPKTNELSLGFDECWGYYHLDAMEDPFDPNYPQALKYRGWPLRRGASFGHS
jgi:hypothetical protein